MDSGEQLQNCQNGYNFMKNELQGLSQLGKGPKIAFRAIWSLVG
jgi:hypothetical protein